MKKAFFNGFMILSALLCFGIAQGQTVTGMVSDEVGPLPGASVLVKGTTTGTQTDFDGNYTIDAASDATLVISYIGFKSVELPVDGQTTINITLEEDASKLDEVVVTGYGSQSKRDVTGSVSTVDADELKAVPATTFAQQLQGRAAGVGIVSDATPGGEATVRIRGFGTTGNNDPLYIIDGVQSRSQANLNPGDIESLQVLKDASSASIYGSRAANGVIIITTKKGKLGKPVISYETYYGIGHADGDVDVLNARELGQYLYLADLYAGKTPGHGQYTFGPNGEVTIPDYVFPSGAFEGDPATNPNLYALEEGNINAITRSADTDWWKESTRSAPIVNHQISASGATESARYAFTLNYFEQKAITKFVSYNRTSIRANTEFRALDNKLTIGENMTLSFDNRKGGFGNDDEQNNVSGSYKHHPLLPVYDIAGNFAGSRGLNLGNNFNPVATLSRQQDNRTYRLRVLGDVFASYDLTDNLQVKTTFGLDATTNRQRFLNRANPEYVEGSFNNGSDQRSNYEYQWQWNTVLTYNKTWNDVHNFDAFIGIEGIQAYGEEIRATRGQFGFETTDIISFLDLGDATTAGNSGFSFLDYTLFSQFGKLNYDYDGKYLAQFILRNDSSSRFLSASQSALFPAFSVGWRVSDEGFMENVEWMNEMKLRYGWGQTGNQEISDYNAYTTYRSNIFNAGYPIDGSPSAPTLGYDANRFGNSEAKWEATTSNNIGLDLLMFDNKFNFNLDLWDRRTTDLLLQVPLNYGAGDAAPPSFNVGEVYNKGIDLNVGWNDQNGDWGYGLNFNLSAYQNEVIRLNSEDTRIFGDATRVPSLTLTEAGLPLSSFYGFQTDGIFQNQAEADAWPEYGDYNAPGKLKVVDVNGDNVINDDDRTVIGSPHPDFTYGINFDLSYKNLALNVFGNGVQGNDVYNYVRYFADFNTFQGNKSRRALFDAWQPTNPRSDPSTWVAANPNATVPIMDADDQISSRPSSYFIEDGSYFRLKNVSLTYTFPNDIMGDLGISNAQIYVQGQNLKTWTKYSGLNPEIQGNRGDDTLGFDGGFMPVSRTYILGLRVSFN
ncbi:MAG TPA: TonB-dependent receptor [Pricia sp.]|nr:TonB-dependent receptor [Pricia sp.]